ncbi:hydroxyproline dehydrogenase-like [Octopus sinensis]|uniref:Proline dehydrogenase n=1 Tax=Octopus sinensis TaxID=2607531 RepID=A0A6P7TDM5_9MOLL|nr:hydroxyproline dehydrogenase-like [Octopus sinensis]
MAFTNIPFRVFRYSMKCNYCFIKPVKNRQIVSSKWFSVHYLSISTVSKQQSIINVTEQDVKTDNLNFDEHVDIFKKKSFRELLRSYLIFGLCSSDLLVSKSGWLLRTGERILGERLMSVVLKSTLYGQFVAGETRPEIEKTIKALKAAGIGSLLGMPMEQDADDNAGERHNWFEKNFKIMMDAIDLVYELDKEFPMTHAKVTALMPTDILVTISNLFPKPTEHPDVLMHIAECMKTGQKLKIDGLNTAQLEELQEALYKLRRIGEYAVEKDVIFMFDAEHTYVNPGLNILTLAMMLNYNHSKPLIFYTYQSYLKGSTDNLEQDLNFVQKHGVKLGAKVVRGAYMDLERARALKQGYADPVNDTYKETCWRYETNVEKMLKKIAKYPQNYRMMIATHNEESIKKLYKKIEEHGVDRRNGTVFFAQTFGMSDHISFTLGSSDVLIYKALPYGPVNETLAYLVRRLQENKSVLKGARREQKLVEQFLKGRLTFWKN